jgi:predicted DNA-binding protein with PD1-like motif
MKSVKTNLNRVIVVKIEPDEDLIESIQKVVLEYKIKSGLIACIGALKEFTIGYFNLETKIYEMKTFKENVELVSCIGNISHKDGEPMVHAHVTLGRRDYSLIGGHLGQPSIVSVTGEVYIYETNLKLTRELENKFKLSLLKI